MNKMYIFAGGHKIADGNGMIEPDGRLSAAPAPEALGRADADPMQDVVDAVDKMNVRQKMWVPEVTFSVKIDKKKLRKVMRTFNVKKTRLPRKLKKAARHAEFKVSDMKPMVNSSQPQGFNIDYCLAIHPAGYPRTKWVHRLVNLWKRKIGQAHRQTAIEMLFKQHLDRIQECSPTTRPVNHQ